MSIWDPQTDRQTDKDILRYPRIVRKTFRLLEEASSSISDPNNPTEVELARINRFRSRLEGRGISQSVIESHMPAHFRQVEQVATEQTEPDRQYGEFHAHLTKEIAARLPEEYRPAHEAVLWDAILSGQPIAVDFRKIAEEGYQPISPQIRPIPPKQK